jgi:SAM-dependent methyltransferase
MEGRVTAGHVTSPLATDPKAGEVQRHFQDTVADFDAIYSGQKSPVARWLDLTLRSDMFERFEATLQEVRSLGPVSVLDVGCGNGIYAITLAQSGARVTGVDFSEPMIALAVKRAAAAGMSGRCEFLTGDFRLLAFPDQFDCSIAIGVFDYLAEPGPFLTAMRSASRRRIIATFPCRWTYRAPLRKVRLGLQGCPVYFYSEPEVRSLFGSVGAHRVRIRRLGHIFLAVADLDG